MKAILQLLEENNNTFEYGQKDLFDRVLEDCDDYYFNGVSSNKIGYYWYSITIDGEEYQVYSK